MTMVDGVMTMANVTMDTKWSVAFMLNAIVYTCLTISALCMVFSPQIFFGAVCGSLLFCCAQCAHFAALIVTGVFRYGLDGPECATSTWPLTEEDGSDTFVDVGNTLSGLFISQCVLYCFYGCIMGVLGNLVCFTNLRNK